MICAILNYKSNLILVKFLLTKRMVYDEPHIVPDPHFFEHLDASQYIRSMLAVRCGCIGVREISTLFYYQCSEVGLQMSLQLGSL